MKGDQRIARIIKALLKLHPKGNEEYFHQVDLSPQARAKAEKYFEQNPLPRILREDLPHQRVSQEKAELLQHQKEVMAYGHVGRGPRPQPPPAYKNPPRVEENPFHDPDQD